MQEDLYNILWIDDEHESLNATKGRAKRNGIHLFPYKSLNGGLSELERNYPFYDGVLLDAKFFEFEDDEANTEDTINVHKAKDRMLQLPKKFEIFILTGQAEAYEDQTFRKAFSNVYEKGKDDDINRLFEDIKKAAQSQKDTQVRHTYKRVFEVCTERYLGEYAGQDLLKLLKVDDESNLEDNFTSIRKIVEDIFNAFYKFNLIPQEFVKPSVALNESSKFLSGKGRDGNFSIEKGYQHLKETHLPPQISNYLRNILAVVQPGSHRSVIDEHVRKVGTPYLFKSILFQLMDVLVWFKMYVDSQPKAGNWIKVETEIKGVDDNSQDLIPGKVININAQKGFAFFKPDSGDSNTFIPAHLVEANRLQELMCLKVEIEEYTDNRTGEIKTRVRRLEVN